MKKSWKLINNNLASYLQGLVDDKQRSEISWQCIYCDESHSGNLLKKVATIKTNYAAGKYKPDLTLLDCHGGLFASVHFIKRKTVDRSLNDFYRDKCVCLQIRVTPDDDFNSLSNKLHIPDFVSVCLNPKCKSCQVPMRKIKLLIVGGDCYKCNHPMKVAAVEAGISRGSSCAGPEDFTQEELITARNNGVVISEHYSKTRQEKYLANTCPNCNAFVGSHYLFTDYISTANYGGYAYDALDMGYYCDACSNPDLGES